MNQRPLVSIVIPAFNPRFFDKALQSALAQTYPNIEIVVCDDSPDDEIKSCVERWSTKTDRSIRYFANPQRLGFQKNLLQCVEEARGGFIKVLCDDDRLFNLAVEMQAQVLIEHDDVSLVLARRFLNDAGDYVLPTRLENSKFSLNSSLFKGEDMLAFFDNTPINFIGNFSASLVRRSDALELLPALTQVGAGFVALLDFALFVCLLKRGNLVMLNTVLSAERLHPKCLSKQPEMVIAADREWQWLKEMLAARDSEAAPATGWVRHIELFNASKDAQHPWKELSVAAVLTNTQAALDNRVGTDSESYAEFYAQWLACRHFTAVQQRLMPQTIAGWPHQPRIVPIVIDADGDRDALMLTLESLYKQIYPPHAVLVLSNALLATDGRVLQLPLQSDWRQQLNGVLGQLEEAQWIYLLRSGDRLADSALVVLAERVAAKQGIHCAYSDEGALVQGESVEPVFKPDFNLDLMRSYPYVGRTLAFDLEKLLALGGFDVALGELAPQDALWRLIEDSGTRAVEHISQIQVESGLSFAQWLSTPEVIDGSEGLLRAHLDRIGVQYRIRHDDLPVINRVDFLHVETPLVSIVLCSGSQLRVLERCVENLLEKTTYAHYELLIVDDGSGDGEMRDWLAAMAQLGSDKLQVLEGASHDNEAARINFAADQAKGEYLVLLSPSIVICASEWLDELLNHAQRPEVGIVGARLLSPEGTVLHAGLVLGLAGAATSPFLGEPAAARGYMQRLQVTQNWSAVGGNCLMVRKSVYDGVGRLDEKAFTLGLNDLDLCLRVGRDGYLIVWTPYATLVLAGEPPASQAAGVLEQERETFYQRWLPEIANDRAYNPSLSLGVSSFTLEAGLRTGWSPFCSRSVPSILGYPVNSSAVGHYRVSQPFKELESAGRVIGRLSYESLSRVDIERMSPDVIVFQGRYVEGASEEIHRTQKYSRALCIFELDDYVVSAPKKNAHTRNKPANTEEMLRRSIGECDRVVVTTQALAEALSSMHNEIRVVPNMLAPELWTGLTSRRGTSKKPRVGWGGGTSHTGDLEIIAEVVRELANDVEWVFFGMCPEALRPYIHEFHPPIGLQGYPAKLASLNLDLALAPLEFHIFNDCKSNLRLLEYGACGYPVICTDTEAYRGFLPCTRVKSNSTQEWLEAIRMHLADPAASYRQGDELREAVYRDFMLRGDNLQHWVWGWFPD